MRHNDQETAELTRDVIELSRELATLERQHEQLRAAAAFALGAWDNVKARDALRVALDGTPAETVRETFDPDAVRALLEFIETGSCDGTYREELARAVRDSERE